MKKHVMNKDVMHDGKALKKGMEIGESHAAHKAMKDQGHLESADYKGDGQIVDESPVSGEPSFDDVSEEQGKKKHGKK